MTLRGSGRGVQSPLYNPTTSFDMPLCMPSCIRHDCLSICLICNIPSCCASHLIDLIERWQPHRSIGAMGDERNLRTYSEVHLENGILMG